MCNPNKLLPTLVLLSLSASTLHANPGDWMERIKGGATEVWEGTKDGARSAAEWTGEKAEEGLEWSKEKGSEGLDATREGLSALSQKGRELIADDNQSNGSQANDGEQPPAPPEARPHVPAAPIQQAI